MRGRCLLFASLLALLAFAPAASAQDPLRARQWNLDMVEADPAHAITGGAGAVVAIVDTGVYAPHEDLQGRLVAGRDIVQNDGDPQDADGHGTHVLGIGGANKGNGRGIVGVAPAASYMPVRVLGDDGSGSDEDVAKGIDHAVAAGADVVNLSLGETIPLSAIGVPSETEDAIKRALDAGVVVVAASGNNGLPLCEQPADTRMICVGSVDKRRMRSMFSSDGDLMAPGGAGVPVRDEDVLSTWRENRYEEVAGTSQAAPHVSAVAALLVSLGLRGEAVKQRILQTASDAGPVGPDPQYGAGIVNARAAVQGLGGSGGSGGPSGGSSQPEGTVSMRRRVRIRTLLRRGLRVRCGAPADGRCKVRARAKRRRVLRGSRQVSAGGETIVRARATKRGRRLLRRRLRRGRNLQLRVHVTPPGAARKTVVVRARA